MEDKNKEKDKDLNEDIYVCICIYSKGVCVFVCFHSFVFGGACVWFVFVCVTNPKKQVSVGECLLYCDKSKCLFNV